MRYVPCSAPGCTAQRLGPPPSECLLSVRDLSVRYGSDVALEDVDLDVHEQRVTALIGPSGCGKTSLLTCLNRMTDLVPGCEVSGSIRFAGRDVGTGGDPFWLRRSVGMVFQRPNPFPLSIRDNLHLPLKEHGTGRADLADRTEEVLRQAESEAAAFAEKTAEPHRGEIARQLGRGTGAAYLAIRRAAEPMLADRTLDEDIRRCGGWWSTRCATRARR